MKIYLLVTIITWSFSFGNTGYSDYQTVNSPNDAAIIIYKEEPSPFEVEPDRKRYELYEIDINEEKKTIKEILIPKITFWVEESKAQKQ